MRDVSVRTMVGILSIRSLCPPEIMVQGVSPRASVDQHDVAPSTVTTGKGRRPEVDRGTSTNMLVNTSSSRPRRSRLLAGAFLLGAMSVSDLGHLPEAWGETRPHEVRIHIEGRQFHPAEVTIQAGEVVSLRFENRDAEIHAFVPDMLFQDVPAEVTGSGAPFYGDRGLSRVLIPGGGRTEIRFVPRAPGQYRYRCDLPGHQMDGHIIVDQGTIPSIHTHSSEPVDEGEGAAQ